MASYEARIALQQSRFKLIEDAAEIEFDTMESEMSRQLVNARLDALERNWTSFQAEHESLCYSLSEVITNHDYMRTKVYERCLAFYVHSRAILMTRREEFDKSTTLRRLSSELVEPRPSTSMLPRSALPRINLPRFSGDYYAWGTFRDLFTSLIRHNVELSNVEKMHYLRSSLTGEASRLVSNLSLSGDHFMLAWQTLCSRYNNRRVLIDFQLDRLANIKPIKTKSAQGLRDLSTTLTEVLGALKVLDCPVQHWDVLLLHQIVKLLDPESREAWEVKLGPSTSYPTLPAFEEFLIGRTQALENVKTTSLHHPMSQGRVRGQTDMPRSKITAHHVSSPVELNPESCPLCKSRHYLASCPVYQGNTVQQKRNAVIRSGKCFNCLGSHLANKCPSTRRCRKCGKKHHSSLHEKRESGKENIPNSNPGNTNKENAPPS